MSRLDSLIKRFIAQRACLNHTATLIADVPGPVFELGLGNGRSYDHLREIFPEREVFAFDRSVSAHPRCIPDADHMIVGDIRETLKYCLPRTGGKAALIHVDLGNGDPTYGMALTAWASPLVASRVLPNGVVVSDAVLDLPDYEPLPLPDDVKPGRIHFYRAPATLSAEG